MSYDSRPETYAHITRVRELMWRVVWELLDRMNEHDLSKMLPPELEVFDEHTPKLKELVYGSPEYRASLEAMKPALEHHYAENSHHPEHFGEDGILGMNLVDLIEMLCDWKAASERTGPPRASLEGGKAVAATAAKFEESISTINAERFGYDDQLQRILLNTVPLLEGEAV